MKGILQVAHKFQVCHRVYRNQRVYIPGAGITVPINERCSALKKFLYIMYIEYTDHLCHKPQQVGSSQTTA